MFKFILVIFFTFLSFDSFASPNGLMGSMSWIMGFFDDINIFLFQTIPQTISDFQIYAVAWFIKLKFSMMLSSLQFAHSVALAFIDLIDISSSINSVISALPQDMRQIAIDVSFFDALTLVIEAYITKLVYSYV